MNKKYSGFSNMYYFRSFLREKGSRYRDIQAELLMVSLAYEKQLRDIYKAHGFNPKRYEKDVKRKEEIEYNKICHYDKDYVSQ
jgi:hypothetical protein